MKPIRVGQIALSAAGYGELMGGRRPRIRMSGIIISSAKNVAAVIGPHPARRYKKMSNSNRKLFATPFSAEYWRLSASELKTTKMIAMAALLTALRIAIKSAKIPVGPDLTITFGFVVNALGSAIYGPVMAILTSTVSDIVGSILFPSGTFFLPFTFVEIAGGVLFALFFYRARITTMRVVLARFSVTAICNLLLNSICMYYYYLFYMGTTYTLFTVPRTVKNLALFPLQSLILVLFFNALLPVTNRMGLTYTHSGKLEIKRKEIVAIILLTIVAALAVVGFYWYKGLI